MRSQRSVDGTTLSNFEEKFEQYNSAHNYECGLNQNLKQMSLSIISGQIILNRINQKVYNLDYFHNYRHNCIT